MNGLVAQLVQQLGVQEGQAKGGAGLLLRLAQKELGADFAQVAEAVPDAQGLVDSAPATGGAGKLMGTLAGALGGGKGGGLENLASLAGGFSKLKLDSVMIEKFVRVLLDFARSKGGPAVMQLLAKAIQGSGPAAP
jgi:hypothetical protein